jgi:murein DD-endopeptidase MepM/ murein hydrolase activator NlpD
VDDRRTSGFPPPAAPVSGTPHPAWSQYPSWEVPLEPYGEPHVGYGDADPLFGALPGGYDTGVCDEQFARHVWWHGNDGHETAPQWQAPGDAIDPNGEWYQGFSQAGPAGSEAFDVHNSSALADLRFVPGQAPADHAPSHNEPTPHQNRSETEPTPSTPPDPPTTRRPGNRGRRAPRRGSVFLAVVAPSVAFVGMAGIAAASVGLGGNGRTAQTAPEPTVQPSAANDEFDTQLSTLSREADDFADRASRTQQRVDLEQRRREERKLRKAEAASKKAEAARKEARRPKFALPVAQKGVGELFGAVGSMWSNRHTGLDFPVPMYTPVMAVTDGTVVAKWNPSYGNIVEVTASDGTQTWYAHLASARIRSGYVKAGTVIGYAGSSGNSSGPHLHLEVHPGGGAPVDPLAWLHSHGLDPT